MFLRSFGARGARSSRVANHVIRQLNGGPCCAKRAPRMLVNDTGDLIDRQCAHEVGAQHPDIVRCLGALSRNPLRDLPRLRKGALGRFDGKEPGRQNR